MPFQGTHVYASIASPRDTVLLVAPLKHVRPASEVESGPPLRLPPQQDQRGPGRSMSGAEGFGHGEVGRAWRSSGELVRYGTPVFLWWCDVMLLSIGFVSGVSELLSEARVACKTCETTTPVRRIIFYPSLHSKVYLAALHGHRPPDPPSLQTSGPTHTIWQSNTTTEGVVVGWTLRTPYSQGVTIHPVMP